MLVGEDDWSDAKLNQQNQITMCQNTANYLKLGFLEEVKYMATRTKYYERHGMNQVSLWRNIKIASFVTVSCPFSTPSQIITPSRWNRYLIA